MGTHYHLLLHLLSPVLSRYTALNTVDTSCDTDRTVQNSSLSPQPSSLLAGYIQTEQDAPRSACILSSTTIHTSRRARMDASSATAEPQSACPASCRRCRIRRSATALQSNRCQS